MGGKVVPSKNTVYITTHFQSLLLLSVLVLCVWTPPFTSAICRPVSRMSAELECKNDHFKPRHCLLHDVYETLCTAIISWIPTSTMTCTWLELSPEKSLKLSNYLIIVVHKQLMLSEQAIKVTICRSRVVSSQRNLAVWVLSRENWR